MSAQQGRLSPSHVLVVASAGAFLAFLDATIVNVAFPSIQQSFGGASIGALSWVLNAYNIIFAAFLVVFGRLTDVIGRRRAYVAGVVLFTLASAWCGAATSLEVLVAARVLQALGAALLVPASLALVVEAFDGPRRAHAIGLWGATAAAAAGLGPPLGGGLVELGGWRWAFFVNVPFGVAAVLAARSGLVESRSPGRRTVPDLVGAALFAGAVALLNLGIIKADDWGWGSSGVLASFAVAAVLVVAFAVRSRGHRSPLLDSALLRIPSFGVASAATLAAGLGFFAYLLTNVLWLQYVWGYGVLRAGLALVPGAVVAAVVAAVLGPVAQRLGYRVVVVPGALVWASAYLWYHQVVGVQPAFWSEWLPGQVLSGIGVGATLPVLGSAALAAVPGGRYATASALVSSARQLGGVLGIALLVLLIGSPSPTQAVAAFRDGWALSIAAFVAVGLLALPLGRVAPIGDAESDPDDVAPLVHLPPAAPPRTQSGTGDAGLADVPMFATLPAAARAALERAARVVTIPAGEWLLREGDPAGSAYVVRRGRLEVSVGDRVVRELGRGAVLGELALITGEARSAGVRARRDSALLEIPRDAFARLLAEEPSATRAVLTQVAGQLRTAGPTLVRPPAPPCVVAVVGVLPGQGAAPVAAALLSRLRTHLSVVQLGGVDPDGLERAERDHDRVLLVADGTDEAWRQTCMRQADAVVLVARSDTDPDVAAALPTCPVQPHVVLVGHDPGPRRRSAWVAATSAWQLTDAPDEHSGAVRALADRLAGRSLGVVLAGGGARAFAHIGVLRELEEAGLVVDRVAGTSMGAIVAAGHATGISGEELEEICYAEFVRRRPFSDWTLPRHSLARGRRTRAGLVRAYGAETVFEGLPRQLHLVSTDLASRSRHVHRRGNLVDAVAASCRLPVLFAPIPRDDGRLLVDGSVLDNLPVDLLTERPEGPVLAVNVPMGAGASRREGRPRVPALGETLLRTMMIGSAGAVAAAQERGAAVLTPTARGVGLLEFHQLDRMVQAGRQAVRALLEQGGLEVLGGKEVPDSAPARVLDGAVVPVQAGPPEHDGMRPVS